MMTATDKYYLYINGQLLGSSSAKYYESVNPSTGEAFALVADASREDIQLAVSAARRSFDEGEWPRLRPEQRGQYLKKIAAGIRAQAKVLADLETADTGKTIKQTTFIDIPTAAETFDYFGNISSELERSENSINAPVKSFIDREPMGVVACIIPWNYPLIFGAWKIAPALIAGNTVIFRPSSQASVSIMKLAQICAEAGLPPGVLNIVSTTDYKAVASLVESPDVDMISFTGGTQAGEEIMALAARTTKKCTLELGGKSPNIVFSDCDFEAALGGTMSAIFMNQGQMCTACSRLFVEDSIYDRFLEELVLRTKRLKIGPACSYETDFGPLNNMPQLETVEGYVRRGIEEGARLLCGGKRPKDQGFSKGFFYEPTIFAGVQNNMAIAQEEIFGPVLCVMRFTEIQEVIDSANDSVYGLAACVWTRDLSKADIVARQLRCGTVWVNTYGGFYNEAPYGGFKRSGYGRELGLDGLLEYTQAKHICIDETPGGKPLVSSWF